MTSIRKRTRTKTRPFNAQRFLQSTGAAKRIVKYGHAEKVFSQGDPATSVMYIQDGGVKLAVLSATGKEAVVAMLGPGDFFGEGCLAGQPLRMATATALTPTTVLIVGKQKMIRVLRKQSSLSDRFITHICYDVGFNNVANFNRRFLEIKGMTPSEFRRHADRRFGV